MNHTTQPGTLLFGYRITYLTEAHRSVALPTIFSPTIPDTWEYVQQDTSIISATLRKRGRVVSQYKKEA